MFSVRNTAKVNCVARSSHYINIETNVTHLERKPNCDDSDMRLEDFLSQRCFNAFPGGIPQKECTRENATRNKSSSNYLNVSITNYTGLLHAFSIYVFAIFGQLRLGERKIRRFWTRTHGEEEEMIRCLHAVGGLPHFEPKVKDSFFFLRMKWVRTRSRLTRVKQSFKEASASFSQEAHASASKFVSVRGGSRLGEIYRWQTNDNGPQQRLDLFLTVNTFAELRPCFLFQNSQQGQTNVPGFVAFQLYYFPQSRLLVFQQNRNVSRN